MRTPVLSALSFCPIFVNLLFLSDTVVLAFFFFFFANSLNEVDLLYLKDETFKRLEL